MIWKKHPELEGKHAFLGASNYHWINWTDEIFQQRYYGQYSMQIGTLIHDLAKQCILNRIKLKQTDTKLILYHLYTNGIPRNIFVKDSPYDPDILLHNLIPFVNDAIGYHMSPEIILYYSINCFGTCDAISFNEREKTLRIHDLKTGNVPAHMEQLYVYTALFCLEYGVNPKNIKIELRIYQNNEVLIETPSFEDIQNLMELIKNRNNDILSIIERNAN